MCEEDGCVTLAVPVQFPHPCKQQQQQYTYGNLADDDVDDDDEQCVLDNLQQLDQQAQSALGEWEWKRDHPEEQQAQERVHFELRQAPIESFPEWWTAKQYMHPELLQECDSIGKILNEDDFGPELCYVAKQHLTQQQSYQGVLVQDAALVAVCASGMMLRARVSLFGHAPSVREVPVRFASGPLKTVDDLRSAVLATVGAAQDYVDR